MTAVDTASALLRAVLESPRDDTARLVYADHLDETGQPEYAAFVRYQVKESRTGYRHFFRARDGIPVWRVWSGAAAKLVPAGAVWYDYFSFARGFVCEIRLPLAAFLEHAESIFRSQPVERVTLTDREPWAPTRDERYWTWADYSVGDAPAEELSVVPSELLRYLPSGFAQYGHGWYSFSTRDVATAQMSVACTRYGRSLAGLPPEIP